MDISLIKLLFDTGLLVLIWIVQLVIYPSFTYYSESDLNKWHAAYTSRISLVVMPLMLGQLFLYGYGLSYDLSISSIAISILIVVVWLITFLIAVPLHNKIQEANNTMLYRQRLVNVNWLRTIAWTLIFIISLYTHYAK